MTLINNRALAFVTSNRVTTHLAVHEHERGYVLAMDNALAYQLMIDGDEARRLSSAFQMAGKNPAAIKLRSTWLSRTRVSISEVRPDGLVQLRVVVYGLTGAGMNQFEIEPEKLMQLGNAWHAHLNGATGPGRLTYP